MSALAAVLLAGCSAKSKEGSGTEVEGGHAQRAPGLIRNYGCGSCHRIPDVTGAIGVGPPLLHFAERVYVAGLPPNDPANLVTWIRHPQSVAPGNAMPELGVTEQDAQDIAADLCSLR